MLFPSNRVCGVMVLLAMSLASQAADAPERTAAATDRPALLDAAFTAFLQHQGRWAYTETHSGAGFASTPRAESIIRVDPSRPYDEQFIPVKLSGQNPTDKQRKDWAKRGEMAAKRHQAHATDGAPAQTPEAEFRIRISNQDVVPDIDHALLVAETDSSATYEIPMHRADGSAFDEYQLTARVAKSLPDFEHVTFRQRSVMRVGAGKNSNGLIEVEFATPDPRFPAVPVKRTSQTTNKPLFGKGGSLLNVAVRTDLRHVTPFDERFGVKLGPLNILQF